jgi:hypothetical protein
MDPENARLRVFAVRRDRRSDPGATWGSVASKIALASFGNFVAQAWAAAGSAWAAVAAMPAGRISAKANAARNAIERTIMAFLLLNRRCRATLQRSPRRFDRTTAVVTSIGVGELSAPVELRQRFSGITDTAQAQVRSHTLQATANHAPGESASDARLQS